MNRYQFLFLNQISQFFVFLFFHVILLLLIFTKTMLLLLFNLIIIFFMKIVFIFSCSGMFRVPGFIDALKKMAFFSACYKNKKYYAYIGQKRIMISRQIAAKWHLLSIIIEFAPTWTTSSFSFFLVRRAKRARYANGTISCLP